MTKRIMMLILCSIGIFEAAAALTVDEQKMVAVIDANQPQAMSMLEKSVNINSGTMNFAGVKKVASLLTPEFESLGFDVWFEDGSAFNRAGHLVAKIEGGTGPKLLLIGHLDTVFEPDSPFQSFTRVDEKHIKGPGVADMKGGNQIMLEALKALHAVGKLSSMNILVVLTGDEELSGRPLALSKKALVDGAKWADVALGFENGDGNPQTANISRRGSVDWTLTVTGTPAHSSQVFKPQVGAGAIYEAARILTQFYEELRSERLLTFNPGRIMGGTQVTHDKGTNSGTTFGKNNVVAEHAIVTGDIRALSLEQLTRVKHKMRAIVEQNLPQTKATLEVGEGYPPLAPKAGNKELLSLYSAVSADLGQGEVTAVNPLNAGAADVSFTSEYVDMALDGLGMSGSAGHTVNETAVVSALASQAKRAAILMSRLHEQAGTGKP
ncbi:M20/M25/M40 family metallo-hydrolase [Alteromonas gilva]|uniref:M20/M25/M40 family metallo-hydrolase n=1 Tax=Alteromonas gilva TaxID=2987522 RepID=A0ABT5L9C2_9ALTE|nr:M20/M25/M40 family metallo-hydrolase [Alteromonas gilva]MDC8832613.1 M20/M25/M40 family metallo-hydrolase [Alteromonas gilva]